MPAIEETQYTVAIIMTSHHIGCFSEGRSPVLFASANILVVSSVSAEY